MRAYRLPALKWIGEGRIIIIAGKPSEQSVTEIDALDAWMEKNAR
jgi:hypothetical protein